MKIKFNILFIVTLILFTARSLYSQHPDYSHLFNELVNRHQQIINLHTFFQKLYPVAIVDNGYFFIFDYDSTQQAYSLIKKTELPFDMPRNIAASFPLSEYNARAACIIGSGIIEKDDIVITIFHEFMHCAQMENDEQKLKSTLNIYKRAAAKNNYMWEITHNFPYSDTLFITYYSSFLNGLKENDSLKILNARKKLRAHLSQENYEYMCWQEWKEGFARYIENVLRKIFSLSTNDTGKDLPFDRITFYYGGDRFMRYIEQHKPDILNHPNDLFTTIFYLDLPE